MSDTLNKLYAQAQGFENAKQQLANQFNGSYDIEKGIFAAKQQALQSAKDLTGQLVGQERLEAGIALAPVAAKTARVGLAAARDPAGTAQQIRSQVSQAAQQQFKRVTGRDLPTSRAEAQEAVEDAVRDAPQAVADRLTGAPEPGDIEFGLLRDNPFRYARPFETSTARPPPDLPEPESVDFRTFQAPTREEGMRQVAQENARLAEEERVGRIRDIDPSELRPVEAPQTAEAAPSLSQQITGLEGHTLRPTYTREADPISEIQPSEIGLQLPRVEQPLTSATPSRGAIPVSQAQRQVFGERDFAPPPRQAPSGTLQGEPLEGGLRGDQTIARAVQSSTGRGEEEEPAAPVAEDAEPSLSLEDRIAAIKARAEQPVNVETPRLDAINQETQAPQPSIDELGERLQRLKASDPSQPVAEAAPKAATDEFVAREAATTAAKTLPEEVAAEAPLLDIPGLGELAIAGTIIGSLASGARKEKQENQQTAGAPPAPPPPSAAPQMAFDAAPVIDSSDYHSM